MIGAEYTAGGGILYTAPHKGGGKLHDMKCHSERKDVTAGPPVSKVPAAGGGEYLVPSLPKTRHRCVHWVTTRFIMANEKRQMPPTEENSMEEEPAPGPRYRSHLSAPQVTHVLPIVSLTCDSHGSCSVH